MTQNQNELHDSQRYEMLSQMADLLVGHHKVEWLLPALAERIKLLLGFDFLVFSLYDPARDGMRLHICQGDRLLRDVAELARGRDAERARRRIPRFVFPPP